MLFLEDKMADQYKFELEDWEEVEQVVRNKLTGIKRYGEILMIDFLKAVFDAGVDAGEITGYKSALQENGIENTDDIRDEEYQAGHDDGYDEGREHGYDSGFEEGEEKGYDNGKEDGWSDGYEQGKEECYDPGYEAGYETGKNNGYDDGYDNGLEAGHDNGYGKGFEDGVESVED